MKTTILAACMLVIPLLAAAQHPPTDAACARLASTIALPNTQVLSARDVAAGAFVPPGGNAGSAFTTLPAFCRVQLKLTPSADSDIRSEVWLPLSGWNGKFQQVGNGAFAGSIQYGALADALARGYAAASTDAGHQGPGATSSFLLLKTVAETWSDA